jgi:branched-subunit amino acid aminotransferase/4-amino-4-deoxychorismate lyase
LDKYGVEGTMKQNIQRWCRSLGLKMVECDLCAADLENCDEVFLSNSVFGIMSVSKIDNREMGQLGIARSMYQKFISNVK